MNMHASYKVFCIGFIVVGSVYTLDKMYKSAIIQTSAPS